MRRLAFVYYLSRPDQVNNQIVFITPYLVTLLVLAFASQRLRPPAADGQPWCKGRHDVTHRHRLGRAASGRASRRPRTPTRPYSHFHVGAAGARRRRAHRHAAATSRTPRTASTLCAECGLVSALATSAAAAGWSPSSRWPATAQPVMPCGRCRQLLWEHGGPDCLRRRRRHARGRCARCCPAPSTSRDGRSHGRLMDAVTSSEPSATVGRLTDEEIRWFLVAYTAGEVADEQAVGAADGHLLPRAWRPTSWPRGRRP